jgi:hypothetical protein
MNTKDLCDEVIRVIEPLNLAGLGDPARRNWYPVNAQDLFENAWKVKATSTQITTLLESCGLVHNAGNRNSFTRCAIEEANFWIDLSRF